MERTNLSTELDGALANRNLGSKGYWECARSGNGNMMTDLLDEDGRDYEEMEGLGEAIEEMDPDESLAEDRGDRSQFKSFREARPGEQPPHAPRPGNGWIRRRIRTGSRKPGGMWLARVRWVQVSPQRYAQLRKAGALKREGLAGVGFVPDGFQMPVAIGGGILLGAILCKFMGRFQTRR